MSVTSYEVFLLRRAAREFGRLADALATSGQQLHQAVESLDNTCSVAEERLSAAIERSEDRLARMRARRAAFEKAMALEDPEAMERARDALLAEDAPTLDAPPPA